MSGSIDITPDTIPAICIRIEALLRGRSYRSTDGRNIEQRQQLDHVRNFGEWFLISDTYGAHSVNPRHGPASITFSDDGFSLSHYSPGGFALTWTFTLEEHHDA